MPQPTTSEREPPSAAATAGSTLGKSWSRWPNSSARRCADSRSCSRPGAEGRDQLLGVVAVLSEPPLGIIGRGAGGDDELPVGGLGQQQLPGRLRQHRTRSRRREGVRRHIPERLLQRPEPLPGPRGPLAQPHAAVAVGAPGTPGQPDRRAGRVLLRDVGSRWWDESRRGCRARER